MHFTDKTATQNSLIPKTNYDVQGVQRITRHPLFFGLSLLGYGNFLARGTLLDACYWLPYSILGLVGAAHLDYRKRLEMLNDPELKQHYDSTSMVPFWAIFNGQQNPPSLEEISPKSLFYTAASAIWWL